MIMITRSDGWGKLLKSEQVLDFYKEKDWKRRKVDQSGRIIIRIWKQLLHLFPGWNYHQVRLRGSRVNWKSTEREISCSQWQFLWHISPNGQALNWRWASGRETEILKAKPIKTIQNWNVSHIRTKWKWTISKFTFTGIRMTNFLNKNEE